MYIMGGIMATIAVCSFVLGVYLILIRSGRYGEKIYLWERLLGVILVLVGCAFALQAYVTFFPATP